MFGDWDTIRCYVSFFLVPVLGIMAQVPLAGQQQLNPPPVLVPDAFYTWWKQQQQRNERRLRQDADVLLRFIANNKDNYWWTTALSNMFVHVDSNHMRSDVLALIPSGYFVCRAFGVLPTYIVFLGGGICDAAVLPDPLLRVVRRAAHMVGIRNNDGDDAVNNNYMLQLWDQWVTPTAAPYVETMKEMVSGNTIIYRDSIVGCVGGLAAFDGVNVMLWLERFLGALLRSSSSNDWSHHDDDGPYQSNDVATTLLTSIPPLCTIFVYLSSAVDAAHNNNNHNTSMSTHYDIGSNSDDPSRHLAGFCFGIGCYGVAKVLSYICRFDGRAGSRYKKARR